MVIVCGGAMNLYKGIQKCHIWDLNLWPKAICELFLPLIELSPVSRGFNNLSIANKTSFTYLHSIVFRRRGLIKKCFDEGDSIEPPSFKYGCYYNGLTTFSVLHIKPKVMIFLHSAQAFQMYNDFLFLFKSI